MTISVTKRFFKKFEKLHPKHRGQIATEIVRLAAGAERADWRKYHTNGTKLITVGEHRVEITQDGDMLIALALFKRNDNYKL